MIFFTRYSPQEEEIFTAEKAENKRLILRTTQARRMDWATKL
jgi:hypothetical protein